VKAISQTGSVQKDLRACLNLEYNQRLVNLDLQII